MTRIRNAYVGTWLRKLLCKPSPRRPYIQKRKTTLDEVCANCHTVPSLPHVQLWDLVATGLILK